SSGTSGATGASWRSRSSRSTRRRRRSSRPRSRTAASTWTPRPASTIRPRATRSSWWRRSGPRRGEGRAPPPPPPRPPELPPRAHAVIAGRLARLSEQARDTAAVAAVIGRAFDHAVVVRLGDEDATVRALDELWRKRIVREQGPHAYDFTHDKLREVAYG